MARLNDFWYSFLEKSGRSKDERFAGEISLEAQGFSGNAQLALILAKKKTAFFTSLATYAIDNEDLPLADELYIVTDKNENPCAVIEIQSVQVVPFNEVTWEMAQCEGEDEDLFAWKEKHTEYLKDEAELVGFEFSDNIKLVFQKFRLLFP